MTRHCDTATDESCQDISWITQWNLVGGLIALGATLFALAFTSCAHNEPLWVERGAVLVTVSAADSGVDAMLVTLADTTSGVASRHSLRLTRVGYQGLFGNLPAGRSYDITAQGLDGLGQLRAEASASVQVPYSDRALANLRLVPAPGRALGVTSDDRRHTLLASPDAASDEVDGPEVGVVTATPGDVRTGGLLDLSAVVDYAAGDISYVWSDDCDGGGFTPQNTAETIWTAPNTVAECLITVTVSDSQGSAEASVGVAVRRPRPPGVERIEPLARIEGDKVVLVGTDLGVSPEVSFGGVVAEISSVEPDRIVAVVPPGLPGGETTVLIATDEGPGLPEPFFNLGNRFYVRTNIGVQAFDQVTLQEQDASTAEADAGVLALSVDGQLLFANNMWGGTVDILDPTDLTVLTTVAVGGMPARMAVTPDDTLLLVANFQDDTVSVVDLDPGSGTFLEVMAELEVGAGPYGFVFTPCFGYAYVMEFHDGAVSQLDIQRSSQTFLQLIDTVALPGGSPSAGVGGA